MKLLVQFVSGPALSCRSLVSGPGALDVRPRPLSVPIPNALCVGARGSRGALCVGPGAGARGPALFCVGPLRARCSVSGPSSATFVSISREPIRSRRAPSSGCGPPAPIRVPPTRQLRSACQPQIRVPPIQPSAFPFSRREPQTLLFGGKVEFEVKTSRTANNWINARTLSGTFSHAWLGPGH